MTLSKIERRHSGFVFALCWLLFRRAISFLMQFDAKNELYAQIIGIYFMQYYKSSNIC